ncbi:MAG: hypothetical protein ACE5H3_01195 [Planctomycetota bacterium]
MLAGSVFLAVLPLLPPFQETSVPVVLRGSAARGREILRGRGHCLECHRIGGQGSFLRGPWLDAGWRDGSPLALRLRERPRPPDLPEGVPGDAYLLESLLRPGAWLVPGYPDLMPAAAGPLLHLGPRDLADLLAVLNPPPEGEEEPLRSVPALRAPGPDPWATLPTGEARRGEQLFFRPDDAPCAGCHLLRLPRLRERFPEVFWEQGGLSGPELTRIALVESPAVVLESILRPQLHPTPGIEEALVETPGERLLSGILLAEGEPGIMLQGATPAGPTFEWVPRDSIAERTPIRRTRMTPIFAELLTPGDLGDLLAFLRVCALESEHLEPASLPGGPLGARDPSAALVSGRWPPGIPLELLSRIPGVRVDWGLPRGATPAFPDRRRSADPPERHPAGNPKD